jgi:hypothetical protein
MWHLHQLRCLVYHDKVCDLLMTLREAMKLLELNERTLDISMLDSAARQRMNSAETSTERDQVLEAYRRVQIFLDPSADERFTMRGSNVLAALSETREVPMPQNANHHEDVVVVEDEHDPPQPNHTLVIETLPSVTADDDDTTFDLDMDFEALESPELIEPDIRTTAELPLLAVSELNPEAPVESESLEQPLGLSSELLTESESLEQPLFAVSGLNPEAPIESESLEQPLFAGSGLSPEVPIESELLEQPLWSGDSTNWATPEPAPVIEAIKNPTQPEFDDSLLQVAPPRPVDETALTIIDESPREEAPVSEKNSVSVKPIEPVPVKPPTPAVVPATPIRPKTNTVNPTKSTATTSTNPERRVSRAAQVTSVSKAYAKPKKKPRNFVPIWAWFIALTMLVGTAIFAAPTLLKQFSPTAPKKPVSNLSVPTVPQAPQNKPIVKPVSKPVVKPVSKPVAKPVVKPVVKPKANVNSTQPKPVVAPPIPTVKPTTPTPSSVSVNPTSPVAIVKPTAKPKPSPVVKPKKPVVQDPRSASSLPPITAVASQKPKPVVSKPKPVVSKPKPATRPKPTAKPMTLRFEDPPAAPTTAEPTTPAPAMTIAAPTETVDPNNLSKEQIGRRFLNEKYYSDWLGRGAKLKYPSWADIPIATQVLGLADFRSAVLISLR